MSKRRKEILGDPGLYLGKLVDYSSKFEQVTGNRDYSLKTIREYVESQHYEVENDPENFRMVLGAFCILLIYWYAMKLKVRGIFQKRISVESKGFRADLLDLYNRCVFEGLDLAPEGEALASQG